MSTQRSIPSARIAAPITGALLAVIVGSCKIAEGVVGAPAAIVGAATGNAGAKPALDHDRAREAVVLLADELVMRVDLGALVLARDSGTQAGAEQALRFRISAAERALAAATEPRPLQALANLVALAAFETRVHEAYWSQHWGEADRQMTEGWRQVEADGLAAIAHFLTAEQVAAMRAALATWRGSATDIEALVRSGAPRFADMAQSASAAGASTSLLSTLGLDPLDSIEPAAREVARARELAERGLFLAQRTPKVLAWRIELLTLELSQQPNVERVLQDLERTSKAAESVAATASDLPEELRMEGDALVKRVSEEVTAQRAGLVADLERTSAPTRELLAETHATLDAGTRLVQALDTTTRTVDAFVARVNPPEPIGAAPTEPAPDEPRAKPFDPVEYTALAAQITTALQELNTAVANLDRSLPAVQRGLDDSAARVDRSVETAYGLALRLVLIAVGAVTAAVLLVRVLARRRERGSTA